MPLGLGLNLKKGGLATPGIVTSNLQLKHNYNTGSVVPVSDGAALFNGTTDTITCGSDSSIDDIFDGGGTVSAWVFANDIGENSYGRIVDKSGGTGAPDGWTFQIRNEASSGTSAKLAFVQAFNSGSNDLSWVTADTAIVYHQWNHVAITYNNASNGNNPIFYINGALITPSESGTTGSFTRDSDASNVWTIGNVSGGTSRTWDGYICNVGAWEAILTQPQIKSIMWKNYAGLIDSEKTNLVSWWNIDEGTGTSVEDSHGSNDGTFA